MKKKENEKTFYTNDGKRMSLSTNDNKDDVKGCNGSAVKGSIVLMKQKLCFRITAKLGNPKRQHCSRQERKWGRAHYLKNPAKKKKIKKERKDFLFIYEPHKRFICSRGWMLRPILAKEKRGNGKKKPNNITRSEERRISKVRKNH